MKNNFKIHTYTFLLSVLSLISNTYTQAQAPVISGFTPASGPVGATTINITGSNFNTHADSNIVSFGAVNIAASSATNTSLTVVVPPGALFQPFSVLNTTDSLAGFSNKPFAITFPSNYAITASDFDPRVDFQLTGLSNNPNSVAIADIDGDGKNDIIATQVNDTLLTILRNVSVWGYINTSSFVVATTFGIHLNPEYVRIADIDGDGKPDIILQNETLAGITIYRNTSTPGNISFAPGIDLNLGYATTSLAISDMDNDGKPDIVTEGSPVYTGTTNICVLKNTTRGDSISFVSNTFSIPTSNGVSNFALCDMDGDGKTDIINNCSFPLGQGILFIMRNTSAGNTISFTNEPTVSVSDICPAIAVGDLDGDGRPDVAAVISLNNNNYGNIVSVYRNTSSTGNISLAAPVNFNTGSAPSYVEINDMDGDGKNDIITTDEVSNDVSILRNTTAPGSITSSSFANAVMLGTTALPQCSATGDLDNDGKPDIVTLSVYNVLSVFRNDPIPLISPLHPVTCQNGAIDLNVTPEDTYQWQVDTGAGFFDLSNVAPYSGVLSDTLHIINTDTVMNGYIFRCLSVNNGVIKYSYTDTLKVHPLPHPVIVNNTPYLSTGNYAAYQWNLNGAPVTAATNQHYTAVQNGSYAVYVTDSNGCSDMSDTVVVANAGVANINAPVINIYPNPATDHVTIDAPIKVNMSVKDITGKEIMNFKNAHEINIQSLAPGIYIIAISDQYGNILKKGKLVKTKDN